MSTMYLVPTLAFDLDATQAAADAWGFNCGPAALCAMTGKTPAELRPCLLDFEQRRYVSPSMMIKILAGLGQEWFRVFSHPQPEAPARASYAIPGLMRVQWSGPWCRQGVPVAARYVRTHWVATRGGTNAEPEEVFDVNAMCAGGWISWEEWSKELVPWLIRESHPRADGKWWPTDCWEFLAPCGNLGAWT